MTHFHTSFSEPQHLLKRNNMKEVLAPKPLNIFLHLIPNFVELLNDTFDVHCERVLYNLKIHLPDHVIDYLDRFVFLELLRISSYEHLRVCMKQAYSYTSQRRTSAVKETLSAVNINTHNRRQYLQKTQMFMRSAVAETLARVFIMRPFLLMRFSETSVCCVE